MQILRIEKWRFLIFSSKMTKNDSKNYAASGDNNVAKMHDEWSRIKFLETDELY